MTAAVMLTCSQHVSQIKYWLLCPSVIQQQGFNIDCFVRQWYNWTVIQFPIEQNWTKSLDKKNYNTVLTLYCPQTKKILFTILRFCWMNDKYHHANIYWTFQTRLVWQNMFKISLLLSCLSFFFIEQNWTE